MTKNNAYKGVAAWMQALLQHSQSNTLGDWWNARTLECVMLGTELSVAGELAVYKDGLDFTKALFQAAKDGSLTQSDVDYNVNKLIMINWKFQNHFFHLEEHEVEIVQDELTSSEEEAIITFTPTVPPDNVVIDLSKITYEMEAESVEVQPAVKKPLGGRPRKQSK